MKYEIDLLSNLILNIKDMNVGRATDRLTFPITREQLQSFKSEYDRLQMLDHVIRAVDETTKKIVMHAVSSEVQKLPKNLRIFFHDAFGDRQIGNVPLIKIMMFLELLQEKFPDTTFQTDPMNEYVYIDWS